MPAKSKSQFKMIQSLRSKHGSKDKASEKDKWVFDSDWTNNVDYDKLSEEFKMEKYKSKLTEFSDSSDTKYLKKAILDFIKENKAGEFYPRIKLNGDNSETNYINVSLKDLQKMAGAL
jgi:hypothetical protein